MQELAADAVVEPHAARYLLHVGAGLFAQIGDLVDEGNLGGEEGVGGVFDQFRRAAAHVKYRRGVQIKRPVQFGQHRARPRVVGADHDAVRMLEVLDGGALAQEFRIGDYLHLRVGTLLAQDALDLVAGADRHGRLGDHDRRARQQRGNLAHRLEHKAQIGVTVAAPRRVPTAIITASASATPTALPAKASRPWRTLASTSSARPGSKMGSRRDQAPRSAPGPCRCR